ncbi:MAG: hypothetical protein ACTS43_02170 [Candidatus Hodgkinia cicadicola]
MLIADRRQLSVRLAPKVPLIRLPAASIAKGIVLLKLSCAITGLDLMTEECLRQSAINVEMCCRSDLPIEQLRYVPKAYTTVNMVSDLRKLTLISLLRIATKFKRITTRYLRS